MPDARINRPPSAGQARSIARPFHCSVLIGLLGMATLMPLQASAAESLPTPLDTTQILRLAYPDGVLPVEVPGAEDGLPERPMAPSPPAALDAGTAAGSSAQSAPDGPATVVAMPDDSGGPGAKPSAAVSGTPEAMPAGLPTAEPAPLAKDAIASLASGGVHAAGKAVASPRTVLPQAAATPGSPAQQQPSAAAAPDTEPAPRPSPVTPVAVPDSRSPQQAKLPEPIQHIGMPGQQPAPPEAMGFPRPQHPSMMPPAATPYGWAHQQGMPPETMRHS
jgi:hypothetical protein